MTSISPSTLAVQTHSPKNSILSAIASKANAGTISSSDQTALDAAVDSIDSSLSSSSTRSPSARSDPSEMKTKVDSLIDDQVSSGKLTSDQASTLKQILSEGGRDGSSAGGTGGVGGPPPGGTPPGPPPSGGTSSKSTTASGTSTTTASSSSSDASDVLTSFLENLRSSQASAGGYGANGTSSGTSLSNSLLFNLQA